MPFKVFDHTGDIGVEISASDLDALFVESARALTAILVVAEGVGASIERSIEVRAPEIDLLLVEWLGELLYRFDTGGWLSAEAQVSVVRDGDGWRVAGRLRGEPFDASRHQPRLALKAVTYHALEVREIAGEWRARVVLDV